MRKIFLAAMTLGLAAWIGLATVNTADAAMAANQSKIPDVHGMVNTDVQSVAWVIYTRWHRGCHRQRWCSSRYWNGYRYVYSRCYWGDCHYGGRRYRGGRGGY